jgi:transcriptional regulator with XRE-family HTH domain
MDTIKTGGLIAQVRREKELTQKDLAERLHVSVQAVSKWERGLSCPDIALLEPLAEALDLTVTELLSGQRGEEPGEEAVRDSLRFGENQLRPKIKKWKWLFILAAALLLAVALGVGYIWARENTEWLPQRETVVRELNVSGQNHQIASAMGSSGYNLHLYEVCLADNVTDVSLQAELWTYEGMEQSWQLMNQGSGNIGREFFGPRRQLMVLSIEPHSEAWSEEEQRWTQMRFDCGVSFSGFSWRGELGTISNPYISGGSYYTIMKDAQTVDQEGAVLLTLSLGGPNGGTYSPGGLPPEYEESVYLVVRMYCE